MELKTVSPKDCTRWNLADRSLAEFGNLYELATDIKKNGQIEPIILRPLPDNTEYKYEVIAGSRRWKACLDANIDVKAIIKPLSDAEAIVAQVRENEKLKLSDYSKGMSYSKMLDSGAVTIAELSNILGFSKAKLHNFLVFAKVPEIIWDAISKKDKISSRSAFTIYSLSKKGDDYVAALIEIAEEIKNGAGGAKIEKLVLDIISGKSDTNKQENIVIANNGEVLAIWRQNKIIFNKNINIDREKLNKLLNEFLAQE